MIKVIVESGEGQKQKYELNKSVFVGRSKKNQIYLNDGALSRRHTKISMKPDGFYVRDLGSKNGTFLNGERLSSPVLLKSGDVITIGTNKILFMDDAVAPVVTNKSKSKEGLQDWSNTPKKKESRANVKPKSAPTPRKEPEPQPFKLPAVASFLIGIGIFTAALFASKSVFLKLLQ